MKKITILKDLTIIQAMKKIATSGSRCLIVADKSNKLLGTLTDGDIRRAILKGKKLSDTISLIYNSKSNYLVKGKFSLKQAKKILLTKNHILLPVVKENLKIIDYLNWEKVFGENKKLKISNNIPLVIMAGGEGKRLRPFTEILPKASGFVEHDSTRSDNIKKEGRSLV